MYLIFANTHYKSLLMEKNNGDTYILKCQNITLGTITDPQIGSGRLSGNFTPFVYFERFRYFCMEYFSSSKITENNQQWLMARQKLAEKYEDDLLDEKSWTLYDAKHRRNIPVSIPMIDAVSNTITLKGYL